MYLYYFVIFKRVLNTYICQCNLFCLAATYIDNANKKKKYVLLYMIFNFDYLWGWPFHSLQWTAHKLDAVLTLCISFTTLLIC